MALKEILYRGSVKNIWATGDNDCVFEFSDRYSIFDWGEMPDTIPSKGAALCIFTQHLFSFLSRPDSWDQWVPSVDFLGQWAETREWQRLCQKGLLNHAKGPVDSEGHFTPKGQLTPFWRVNHVDVLSPTLEKGNYDYDSYGKRPTDALVPLEVIFRFGIGEKSSLLKRASDPETLRDLELSTPPRPGDHYRLPLIDFSTKLEPLDRSLNYQQARQMASLTDVEMERLLRLSKMIALRLYDLFGDFGMYLQDGKLEFAFAPGENGHRDFMLVDAFGPDEMRLVAGGQQVSKEFFRMYYRQTKWYQTLQEVKVKDIPHWKNEVKSICLPGPLPEAYVEWGSMMYQSLANEMSKRIGARESFGRTWSLDKVLSRMGQLQNQTHPDNTYFIQKVNL